VDTSQRVRLLAGHVVVVVVALALMTLLVSRQQRAWVAERTGESLERAAGHVAAGLAAEGDWEATAARLGATLGHRVTLLDRSGRVLGDSEVPPGELAGVENHAGRPEVAAALRGGAGRSLRHSHTIGMDLVYVAVPAPRRGPVAVVRLAEPLGDRQVIDAATGLVAWPVSAP